MESQETREEAGWLRVLDWGSGYRVAPRGGS